MGDLPARELGASLRASGFAVGRLKTGTPPRLDGTTIDWASLEEQWGDAEPEPFSSMTERIVNPQIACRITRTTPQPMPSSRAISPVAAVHRRDLGPGPRYCPSIEDKITDSPTATGTRFSSNPRGWTSDYLSQRRLDLAAAASSRPSSARSPASSARDFAAGYAIEYDMSIRASFSPASKPGASPVSFSPARSTARRAMRRPPPRASRRDQRGGIRWRSEPHRLRPGQSLIGVMIDDLVTHGVTSPIACSPPGPNIACRLRADNADERLTPRGLEIGCVGAGAGRPRHAARAEKLARARAMLMERSLTSSAAARYGLPVNQDGQRRSAWTLLSFPDIGFARLREIWPELAGVEPGVAAQVEIDARYAAYLDRQAADIKSYRRDDQLALPATLDYGAIKGLSTELAGRLSKLRPRTLAQAQRIEGVTPAALTLLAARARRA